MDVLLPYLFIADLYNRRVEVVYFDPENGTASLVGSISRDFQSPVGVACAMIPYRSQGQGFYYEIAVLDQSAADIEIFTNSFSTWSYLRTIGSGLFGSKSLNHPTAIKYGRHLVDNEQTKQLYIVDQGNHRIVSRPSSTDPSAQVLETPPDLFPDSSYLTSIDCDYFGYVYVTDNSSGTVYVLDPTLRAVVGQYGSKGQGAGQLWYPQSISHAIGWSRETNPATGVQDPLNMGNFAIGEQLGSQTGIRNFVQGFDIANLTGSYQPGNGCNWNSDYVAAQWNQSGPTYTTIEVTNSGGQVVHKESSVIRMAGAQQFSYYPGASDTVAPAHYYQIQVTSEGMYDHRLSDTTMSVDFIRNVGTCSGNGGSQTRIIGGGQFAVEDPATNLPVDAIYGKPSQWYKITTQYGDVCPDTAKGVKFRWQAAGYDSVYFSASIDPGQARLNRTLKTNVPWVYATFRSNTVHTQGVTLDLAQVVYYYVDAYGNEQPTGPCVSGGQGFDEMGVGYTSSTLNFPYYCSAPGYSCNPPPPQPGGCPFLYSWEDTGYVFVNNILPQSEADSAGPVYRQDFVPVREIDHSDTSAIRLILREEEWETSYLDKLELVSYDFPDHLDDWNYDDQGRPLTVDTGGLPPVSALTNNGEDVTAAVAYSDGSVFSSPGPGYLDLVYQFGQQAAGRSRLGSALLSSPGGIAVPPNPKASVEKVAVTTSTHRNLPVMVYASNADGVLVPVAYVSPRVNRLAQLTDLSDFIIGGILKVRISWPNQFEADNLDFLTFDRPAAVSRTVPLLSAFHSTLGSVAKQLTATGDQPVLLRPGESISLEYRPDTIGLGMVRLYALKARGRYELGEQNVGRYATNVPREFSFDQNYPNPFNPSTVFSFALPSPEHVKLELYNVLGQEVITLINGDYAAGRFKWEWDGRATNGQSVSSGVYFARLTAGKFASTKKMVVVK